MTTLVSDLLTVMLRHLQETATLSSRLWVEPELVQYIADADREFLALTGIVKQAGSVLAVAGQSIYDEPADSIDVERISWNGKKLYPQTRYELDRQKPNWKADSGAPQRYHRDHLPPKQFEVWKKPTATGTGYATSGTYGTLRRTSGLTYTTSGTYGVLRSARGTDRNYFYAGGPYGTLRRAVSGASNFIVFYDTLPSPVSLPTHALTTPDGFCRYVMYRALEKTWAKEGDGQDIERAAFCGTRFERGVALAQRLVYGDEIQQESKHG